MGRYTKNLLKLKRFFRNDSGSFLVLFGLSFTVILYVMLLAMDYSNTENEGQKLQQVLDSVSVSLSNMDDVTEANVQGKGESLMSQKYPEFKEVTTVAFSLTEGGTVVKAEADMKLTDKYTAGFVKGERKVSRSSSSLMPLDNVDIHIFIDSSLTMGLPSVPVAKVEDIMDGGCIFACHDGGTTARKLGYKTKLDVVNHAVKGMLQAIDNANTNKQKPSKITYSLYRYAQGPYWSSSNNYEIDDDPWPSGLHSEADLATGRDSVPVAPLVIATEKTTDLTKELNKTWDLVGGSNLNTPLRVIYDNIRLRDKIRKWSENNNPIDFSSNTHRSDFFNSLPPEIGIPQNKFFTSFKQGKEKREDEIAANMAHVTKRTFVIFISDGDHRKAPDQFTFDSCNNIKDMKNTSLYTVMVQNDPNTYAVQWRKFGDINFVGYEEKDRFGRYGLEGSGYIFGLNHAEVLMRRCASSQNHFFSGEFEDELNARFRELAKRLATEIPRLTNSK